MTDVETGRAESISPSTVLSRVVHLKARERFYPRHEFLSSPAVYFSLEFEQSILTDKSERPLSSDEADVCFHELSSPQQFRAVIDGCTSNRTPTLPQLHLILTKHMANAYNPSRQKNKTVLSFNEYLIVVTRQRGVTDIRGIYVDAQPLRDISLDVGDEAVHLL